jgi:hypothetical protein
MSSKSPFLNTSFFHTVLFEIEDSVQSVIEIFSDSSLSTNSSSLMMLDSLGLPIEIFFSLSSHSSWALYACSIYSKKNSHELSLSEL